MSNQEIRYLIKNELQYLKFINPKSTYHYKTIYNKYKNIIDVHVEFLKNNVNVGEKLYCFFNNIKTNRKCVCGNSLNFSTFSNGYHNTCSNSCGQSFLLEDIKKIFHDKHENNYTYFWDTYKNVTTKMKMECNICNTVFERTPKDHKTCLFCPKCFRKFVNQHNTKKFKNLLIEFRRIHGNTFYYFRNTYTKATNKIKIKCLVCGLIFQQRCVDHKKGNGGCPECKKQSQVISLDTASVHFYNKHKNKYKYDWSTYKDTSTKMRIICTVHGEFWQTPNSHKGGCGCPKCKTSKGESIICYHLDKNNIKFLNQFRFNDCIYKKPLPFDFYLPELNMCIEYDGEQHFTPIVDFGGERGFKRVLRNDKIKTEYCKNNNIQLIRIPYWEFNNIEEILKEKLNIK